MSQLIPLAVASAFWPILLVVVLVSLRAPSPVRLMASFLAAGLLTTVTVGLVVIYALKDSPLVSNDRSWFGPVVEIVLGCVALLAALFFHRRSAARPLRDPDGDEPGKRPGRVERMLGRGAPLAFVAGILLNIVPGVLPLVALENIAELDKSFPETLALLVAFYVIMFAFVEIPLIGYLFAPARTTRATVDFNAWLDRNGYRMAVGALTLVGLYLVVRGIARLAV